MHLLEYLAKRAAEPYIVRVNQMPTSIKSVGSPDDRVLRMAISDDRRDRDGDITPQRGADNRGFALHPGVFVNHFQAQMQRGAETPWTMPVARALKLLIEPVNGLDTTFADVRFAGLEGQGSKEAELAYAMTRDKFWTGVSQGFKGRRFARLPDSVLTPQEIEAQKAGRFLGALIPEYERYEFSIVGIPANVGGTADVKSIYTVAEFVEYARKYLDGPQLEDFRRGLTAIDGPEVICVGCSPAEKAPSRLLEIAAATTEGDPLLEFDHWQDVVGKACPIDSIAAPELVGQPTEIPATVEKTVEKAAACGCGAKAAEPIEKSVSGLALILAQLTTLADRLTSAVERIEAAEIDDAAEAEAPVAEQPMVASFVEEIRTEMKVLAADVSARLERTERRVEDSHAEFYLAHLNSKSTAPHDTRSDPAPRVEAAKPPAAVAVKQLPAVDLSALVPQIAKALGAEVTKRVDAAIYTARGGIEIP